MSETLSPEKIRVYLEDHGQDFLRFTLVDGVISDANLQGSVWNGRIVRNRNLKPGSIIEFEDGNALKYPVQTVSFA
jgi:hypothetical protein